jgi:hypothetical protein
MLDVTGLEIRALERRLERTISDYLAISRAGSLFAHAAEEQAEADAWARMMEARDELDACRAEAAAEAAAGGSPAAGRVGGDG